MLEELLLKGTIKGCGLGTLFPDFQYCYDQNVSLYINNESILSYDLREGGYINRFDAMREGDK